MSDTAEKIVIACPNCHKHYRVPATMVGKTATCPCGSVFAVEPPPPPSAPQEDLPPPESSEPTDSSADPVIQPPADGASYDNYEEAPATPVVAGPTDCSGHPGTPAVCACADCHKLLCRACSFPQHDGRNLCAACAIRSASPSLSGSKAFSSAVVVGTCAAHSDVEAVARCSYCHTLLCATCDFQFDQTFHLCPRCATTPPKGLGRCRTILLTGSLVALGLTLVGLIAKVVISASLSGDDGALAEFIHQMFVYVLLIPAILGFALAVGSFARRAINPPLIWVSLVLNTLMVVFWLGLLLVLTFSPAPPAV